MKEKEMAAILEEIKQCKLPEDYQMRYHRYELLKRAYRAKLPSEDWEWFCKQVADLFGI